MGSWVSLSRIKRDDCITLSDRDAVIFAEVKDNIIDGYQGVLDLPDYPTHEELSDYIGKFKDETREEYYDRALVEVAELKEVLNKARKFLEVSDVEADYLYNERSFEELFFVKREYDLENELLDVFEKDFENEYTDETMPIVLDASMFTCFCEISGYDNDFDDSYIYKLSVG